MPRKKKEEPKKLKWFDVAPYIRKYNAEIYMFMGARSCGKSYSCLKFLLKRYRDYGERFVYLRRWADDVKQFQCETLIKQELVDEIFGPGYEIKYRNHVFSLCHTYENEKGKEVTDKVPVAYSIAISDSHHIKGTNFVDTKWIMFDEFIEMGNKELASEYNKYEQIISTIKRTNKIKIIMLCNLISKYSSYFVRNGINSDKLKIGEVSESLHENGKTKVMCLWTEVDPEIIDRATELTSSKVIGGGWEINDCDDIPTIEGEQVTEQLVFTALLPEIEAKIGVYLRYGEWTSYHTNDVGLVVSEENEREFLVIRRVKNDVRSSYYNLTSKKSLSQSDFHELNLMLKDILENCDINIKEELMKGRVFASDPFVGDIFTQIWNYYDGTEIKNLL